MKNERITEGFVRNFIQKDKEFLGKRIVLEEQSSKDMKINGLLKNASKSGGSKGFPEFILQYKNDPNFIIIFECKADNRQHRSREGNKYKDYAVDGVLLYSSFLSKEFDVLSIAVSGESERTLRISHFLQLKGTKEAQPIFTDNKFLPLDDYLNGYKTDERKFNQDFQELLKYSKTLNDKLHVLKVPESNRSLLISGALIALSDRAFCNAYKFQKPKELSENLINTIKNKLTDVQNQHIEDIITNYSFIATHTILSKKENKLRDIIEEVDIRINNFIKTYKYFDTLGQFYIEFLRYANNDKGLGIVLTPPHITELFSEIVHVNRDCIVLDTCAGTGGFLISAMQKMIIDATGDKKMEQQIKSQQIIGVEVQHGIFALACSNMYIHGDGRSNLIKGSCFDEDTMRLIRKFKPNVGFLNPPYKTNKGDIEELEFVLNNLSLLEKGSYCVAIIPMNCALAQSGERLALKEKLLKENTLEAVFSMPNELFYNSDISVHTCILVFRAKEKHLDGYKTYFGYWKDDGFTKIKSERGNFNNRWSSIKKVWLDAYRNKEEIVGLSVKKAVSADDEWCAEAYMETDYANLKRENFENKILDFSSYLFSHKIKNNVSNSTIADTEIEFDVHKWKSFRYDQIFDIKKGYYNKKPPVSESGEIIFVGATDSNNGVTSRHTLEDIITYEKTGIKNSTIDGKLFKANCITISNNGSVGYAFYQRTDFTCSHDVNPVYLKGERMNVYIAMFLAAVIELEQYRWGYGRKWRPKRMPCSIIKLPVDRKDDPDWKFMQEYIKSLPYSSNL